MTEAQKKLEDLEFGQVCMERTIERLNEVVVEHTRTLESVERLLGRLEQRVRELEHRVGEGDGEGPALTDQDDLTTP